MNRVDFVLNRSVKDKTTFYDPINNGNIKIFVNDKAAPLVQAMKLEVDLSYGYIRASIKRIKTSNSQDEVSGLITPIQFNTDGTAARYGSVDSENNLATEDINPNMERNVLILERITNDGKFTSFYLRTMISQ